VSVEEFKYSEDRNITIDNYKDLFYTTYLRLKGHTFHYDVDLENSVANFDYY